MASRVSVPCSSRRVLGLHAMAMDSVPALRRAAAALRYVSDRAGLGGGLTFNVKLSGRLALFARRPRWLGGPITHGTTCSAALRPELRLRACALQIALPAAPHGVPAKTANYRARPVTPVELPSRST
jgi:hypothetical protein